MPNKREHPPLRRLGTWEWFKQQHNTPGGGGGDNLRGVCFGRAKIRGGNIWNGSLEMKEKFGIRSLAVAC